MSAQQRADAILVEMKAAHEGWSSEDRISALAVALGFAIADATWPEPFFTSIVASGSLIGAAAALRGEQHAALGAGPCVGRA